MLEQPEQLIDTAFQNFVDLNFMLRRGETPDMMHARRTQTAAVIASTILNDMYPEIESRVHFHDGLERHGLSQPTLTTSQWRRVVRHNFAAIHETRNFNPTSVECLEALLSDDPRIQIQS